MKKRAGTLAAAFFLVCVMAVVGYLLFEDLSEPVRPESPRPAPLAGTADDREASPAPDAEETSNAPIPLTTEVVEISGTVVDGTGKGVADATVRVVPAEAVEPVRTAPDGSFTVPGLPTGAYSMVAEKAGVGVARLDEVPAPSRQVLLTLHPTCTVSGRVVSAMSGKPVAAFEVASISGNLTLDDALGFADWIPVEAPEGDFKIEARANGNVVCVVARAPGMAPAMTVTRELNPGDTEEDVVIELNPGATVRGRVTNPQGQPLAKANVALINERNRRTEHKKTETDAGGNYQLDGLLPDNRQIIARHELYVPSTVDIEPKMGATITADFVLEPGAAIEGVVLQNGSPVPECDVLFRGGLVSSRTDAAGRYVLRPVQGGVGNVSAHLTASTGQKGTVTKFVEVTAGKTTTVDFTIPGAPVVIEGKVSIGGAAPAHGTLSARVEGPAGTTSSADKISAAGEYRLTLLLPGETSIRVNALSPGDKTPCDTEFQMNTEEGQTIRQDFALALPSALAGAVAGLGAGEEASASLLPPGSGPIAAESLQEVFKLSASAVQSVQVGKDGSFRFERVRPGSYTLVVVAAEAPDVEHLGELPRIRSASREVTIPEGAEIEADVTLP